MSIAKDEAGRIIEIRDKDNNLVYSREQEKKEITKKTIKALENTNGRSSDQTSKAEDRLEEIFG